MIFDEGTSKGTSWCKSKHSDDSTDTDDYFNGVHKKRKISDPAAFEDEEVCSSYNVSAPPELTCYLPPGFPSKKRKSLSTLSKDATDELVVKFNDSRKKQKTVCDDDADRVMEIMLRQAHRFVQSVGLDIDYTDLVSFFQSYFRNKTDIKSDVKLKTVKEIKSNSLVSGNPDSKEILHHDTQKIDDHPKETSNLPNWAQSGANASGSGRFECPECSKTFHDYGGLGGHMASHCTNNRSALGIRPEYECPICTNKYNSCQALGGHVAGHKRKNKQTEAGSSNSGGQKSYSCNICSKKFSTGQALGGHKTCHRNPPENSIVEQSSDQAAQQPPLLPESFDQAEQDPPLLSESSGQGTSSQNLVLVPDLNDTPNYE